MAKRTRKPTFMDELMAEPIPLQGVLGVIVTRGFAYQWLKDCGFDPSDRGYASLDYMVFSHKASTEPLTDLTEPSTMRFLTSVQNCIRKDREA